MLTLLEQTATPGVEHVTEGTYRRTITVSGHPGVLELTSGGPDHLLLRLHLPRWEPLVHIVGRARRLASLDLDLDAAMPHLAGDPALAPLLARRPGLRPPGTWDALETGVRAILDQHLSGETGRRLVEAFGQPAPGLLALGLTHTFPEPRVLLGAGLEEVGIPSPAAAAVTSFTQAVYDGDLRLDRSVPLAPLLTSLAGIEGVNEVTAHHIALRVGEPDAFPLDDVPGERAEPGQSGWAVQARDSHRWSPWRALAATHLTGTPSRAHLRRTCVGPAPGERSRPHSS